MRSVICATLGKGLEEIERAGEGKTEEEETGRVQDEEGRSGRAEKGGICAWGKGCTETGCERA